MNELSRAIPFKQHTISTTWIFFLEGIIKFTCRPLTNDLTQQMDEHKIEMKIALMKIACNRKS